MWVRDLKEETSFHGLEEEWSAHLENPVWYALYNPITDVFRTIMPAMRHVHGLFVVRRHR